MRQANEIQWQRGYRTINGRTVEVEEALLTHEQYDMAIAAAIEWRDQRPSPEMTEIASAHEIHGHLPGCVSCKEIDAALAASVGDAPTDRDQAMSDLQKEINRLRRACAMQDDEICQTLGKVLGYPWFKDDLKNFPDATEADGVCVGEHVAESLASEAANKITSLQAQVEALRGILAETVRCFTYPEMRRQERVMVEKVAAALAALARGD